jgi:ion channel-forming bestrophin family protein
MVRSIFALVATAALWWNSASAFAPIVSSTTSSRFGTAIHGNTKSPPAMPPVKDIAYGEESRKYRRTVYSHDDWRKHRSQDRFLYYISSLFSSGIYKNLGREVTATTAVAAFVCLYNAIVGGYTDFEGIKHAALVSSSLLPLLGLPLAPFTLSTPALGLLLGTFMCASGIHGVVALPNTRSCHPNSVSHEHQLPEMGRG